MPKPIRSAYEIALDRELSESKEDLEENNGFFVDDRPSKIVGSRAKHPSSNDKNEAIKLESETEIKKQSTVKNKRGLDMNAYISCNVTLSNKLLKAINNGSTASLFMGPFEKNKAKGFLRFETSDSNFDSLKDLSNTSIMLEVVEVGEDIPEIGGENPVVSFGAMSSKILEKIAVTDPKKHISHFSQTVNVKPDKVSQDEKKKAIKAVLKNKQTEILSYDQLIEECNKTKGIDLPPPSSKKPQNGVRFTRAEAMEFEKELMSLPKLNKRIFIKNNCQSSIEIGDIPIGKNSLILSPFEVYDLSRIPVRIIRDSSNLRSFILSKSNYISLVSEEEYNQWLENSTGDTDNITIGGYKAFSGERASEKAAKEMFDSETDFIEDDNPKSNSRKVHKAEIDEESAMEITEDDLNTPSLFDSEETTDILKKMPKERDPGFVPVSQQKKPSDGSKSIRRV